MKFTYFLSGVFILALSGSTPILADEATDLKDPDFGAQLSVETEDALVQFQYSLKAIIEGTGAKISDIQVDQSMGTDGDFSLLDTSCTVSATVGIPGGTEVSIEATAPTCGQAIEMVLDGITELVADRLG